MAEHLTALIISPHVSAARYSQDVFSSVCGCFTSRCRSGRSSPTPRTLEPRQGTFALKRVTCGHGIETCAFAFMYCFLFACAIETMRACKYKVQFWSNHAQGVWCQFAISASKPLCVSWLCIYCVGIRTHTHTHTRIFVRWWTQTRVHAHIILHNIAYSCTYTHIYIYILYSMHIFVYTDIFMHLHPYMHICICTYFRIHIHPSMLTFIPWLQAWKSCSLAPFPPTLCSDLRDFHRLL